MSTNSDKMKRYERLAVKSRSTTFLSAIYIPMTAISKPQRFTIRKLSITAFWHILFLATLGATALNTKKRSTFIRKVQTKAKWSVLPVSDFAMKPVM